MPDEKVTASQEVDPVVTYLAEAEQRWETAENARWQDYPTALRSLADVPRLLAAVEAARNVHYLRENPRMESGDDTHCGLCGRRWPCVERQATDAAITAALTGKTGT